jgi:hypothetical protein
MDIDKMEDKSEVKTDNNNSKNKGGGHQLMFESVLELVRRKIVVQTQPNLNENNLPLKP